MDLTSILEVVAQAIYISLGAIALYGVFCVIMLARRISQKKFSNAGVAEQFLEEVSDNLKQQNFDAVVELCDSPAYWSKAVPQLVVLGLANKGRGPSKLRKLLAETFEREVLADLEYRTSYINTIVKSAPMIGLLGTVTGMINAFGKIASMQKAGGDPSALAGDISFALFTTALGLSVAIPLVLAGAMIHVRIAKLQDAVQQHIGIFLDELETAVTRKGKH